MNRQMAASEGNVTQTRGNFDPSPVSRYWLRNIRLLTMINMLNFI